MLINFADKVVVGLAAKPIMEELKLTPEQFGFLGSSFFFLFAISAVVVGFISNRVQAKPLLLTMAIVWSVVQFPMLGPIGLEVLVVCRIILGAGEWGSWFDKWAKIETQQFTYAFNCLMGRDDVTGRLGEITAPALIIHGDADAAIPVSKAEVLRDQLAGRTELVVIPGGTHAANTSGTPRPASGAAKIHHLRGRLVRLQQRHSETRRAQEARRIRRCAARKIL